jgi:hypothetical protein
MLLTPELELCDAAFGGSFVDKNDSHLCRLNGLKSTGVHNAACW